MQDIRRVLQLAGRRLLVVGMLNTVVWTLTVAIAVLVVVIVADRALGLGLGEATWRSLPVLAWVSIAAVGVGIVAGVVWAFVARKREAAVARVVDERAGLRESLSTALCVERAEDPWSRAVVESAADKARRVVVKDAIPIEGPRSWPIPTATAALLILAFFLMPPLDLRGKRAEAKAAEDARQEIEVAERDAREAEDKMREILQRSGLTLDEDMLDADLDADLAKPKTAETVRKDAIRKLTNLNEKLEKQLNSEEAKTLDAMKEMMRRLTMPGQGELSEFAREMSRGNFDKARQELEKVAQKLNSGELTGAESEQLAKQMKNLASQLEQMAQQKGALEQMMQKAGVSPEQAKQLAANPEAMQQALQNNKNLSEQQKQQLQEAAKAMQQAASQCQGMGQAMSQMASSMSQSGMNQAGQQAMDAMSGQLSAMEMMQGDMQSISDAMSQCQNQMAKLGECNGSQGWGECSSKGPGMTGQWQPGSSMSQGGGSGGPGKGNGAGPDAQDADFMLQTEKANVQNTGGAIIGSRFVFGEQIKGEASEAFGAAIEVAAEQANEEISNMNVDPQFRGAVKHYYGRLEERVKAERAKNPPAGESGGAGGGAAAETKDD